MKKHTVLFFLVITAPLAAQPREQLCLNGTWQFTPGDMRQTEPAAGAAWKDFPVPSFWDRADEFGVKADWPADLACAWYQRTFTVDPGWKGRRVYLRFDAVKAVCEVFVNGTCVGRNEDGFMPFRFDVTERVRFGQTNDVRVKVVNWRGWLARDAKDLQLPVGVLITGANALLAPIGMPMRSGNFAGIWQDVWLEAMPAAHIERVKISTDVGAKKIAVRTWVKGGGELRIVHDVLEGEKVVLSLGPGVVTNAEMTKMWSGFRLWETYDPHLYVLRTRLVDGAGGVADEVRTRFGVRQVEIRGKDIYLNGRRITLLADQWMQVGDPAGCIAYRYEYAKAFFQLLKRCNINTVRLHSQPSPPSTLDAADEVGMLILAESANYGSDGHMRLTDPVYQKRSVDHIRRMIERDQNHPSIIAWSLGNEYVPPESHRRALYETAKRLDPTRIAYVDCGAGPSDLESPHYVWHWAKSYQLPNTAYWFGDSAMAKQILGRPAESIPQPCFMGEFLETSSIVASGAASVFLGPRFSQASDSEKRLAYYSALHMVTEGVRYTGLAGMNPFTLVHDTWTFCVSGGEMRWPNDSGSGMRPRKLGSLKVNPRFVSGDAFVWSKMNEDVRFAYSPMYAYMKEYSHTFCSGAKVRRRVVCFDDDRRPVEKTVHWTVRVGEKTIGEGRHRVGSQIGFADEFDIAFEVPKTAARTDGRIELRVEAEGQSVFENSVKIAIFPPAGKASDASDVGFWRVPDKEREAIARMGVAGRNAASVDDLTGLKVLVMTAAGLDGREDGTFFEAVAEFVRRGGAVLSFGQRQSRAGWMPGLLSSDVDSWTTIGFRAVDHPVLAGLTDDDLRFWGADHVISRGNFRINELPKPATPLVVAGSSMGVVHAPLVEYRYGKGTYLACQMTVLENPEEGVAGVLLRNMVAYALKADRVATPVAETFKYRPRWEVRLRADEAMKPSPADAYRISHLSYVCGSDQPVLDALRSGCVAEWRVRDLPTGVTQANLGIRLRSGDGGHAHKGPFKYRMEVDGKPVAMKPTYDEEQMTFDSFQGWKIVMGTWRATRAVKVHNGSRIRVRAEQDWSAVTWIELAGELDEKADRR